MLHWGQAWAPVGCNRYKVALIEALNLHLAERRRLEHEQAVHSAEQLATATAAAGGSQAAAAPAAAAGGSQAAVAGGSQGNGFIAVRSAQQSAPPVLANVQQLDEEVEIRGVCDGCGQNVLSNDEGRKREGSQYYHEQCTKCFHPR